MIFKKIELLFSRYFHKDNSPEELTVFRTEFETIFDYFRDELEAELGRKRFELLYEIYMIFDMYEPDENIRENDNHCIDEERLLKVIKEKYGEIRERDADENIKGS